MNQLVVARKRCAAASFAAGMFALCAGSPASPTEVALGAALSRSAGSPTDLRVAVDDAERAGAARAASAFATVGRGLFGPVLMRDDLEAYVPGSLGGAGISAPPSFLDPPDFPWGVNTLRGQSNQNYVSLVDLSGAPLGGTNGVVNSSQALRIRTATAQPSGGFFTGASLRWDPVLIASADGPARGSSEVFISSVNELYTFETANVLSGFISARLIWGGACDPEIHGDCGDPVNPVVNAPPNFYFLGLDPESFTTGIFRPSAWCLDVFGNVIAGCVPPGGAAVGDPAMVPTQNWVRIEWSFGADGTMTALLDMQDGSGLVPMAQSMILTTPSLNRVGWNGGFESQDASMHIDNIEASGSVFEVPTPPPFECPFLDDLEWLFTGPLLGQTAEWTPALSGAVVVVEDGARGNVLQQTNGGFGVYARSVGRRLPMGVAYPGEPVTVCFDALTTGETLRAFALDSEPADAVPAGVSARLFVGLEGAGSPPFFDQTLYVQINPAYDPLVDGPPTPGVDVASTGFQWTTGVYHAVCVVIEVDNTMTVSVDGAVVYTGQAFAAGVSGLLVESSNAEGREGDVLRLDNVVMACGDLPTVDLPPLVTPYCDNFEWGVPGLSPAEHIDDPQSPLGSTRYTASVGVTIESADLAPGGVSKVVAMRNVFRDVAQAATPDINGSSQFLFVQFVSLLPSVQVDDEVGWRMTMDLAMNDFLTSRGFSPAQLADVGSSYELVGFLWYHAPDDRFYLFGSPANASPGDDLVIIDTGFTRAGLGIAADATFEASAEYAPASGTVRWTVNGTVVGETNPIVGEDDQGAPRLHRNLDAVFVWGGDDATAGDDPLSTLYLDNLCVFASGVEVCPGDLNGDNVVNFADLNAVLAGFGQSGDGLPGDADGDGVVNFVDLNLVLSRFGSSCE